MIWSVPRKSQSCWISSRDLVVLGLPVFLEFPLDKALVLALARRCPGGARRRDPGPGEAQLVGAEEEAQLAVPLGDVAEAPSFGRLAADAVELGVLGPDGEDVLGLAPDVGHLEVDIGRRRRRPGTAGGGRNSPTRAGAAPRPSPPTKQRSSLRCSGPLGIIRRPGPAWRPRPSSCRRRRYRSGRPEGLVPAQVVVVGREDDHPLARGRRSWPATIPATLSPRPCGRLASGGP